MGRGVKMAQGNARTIRFAAIWAPAAIFAARLGPGGIIAGNMVEITIDAEATFQED